MDTSTGDVAELLPDEAAAAAAASNTTTAAAAPATTPRVIDRRPSSLWRNRDFILLWSGQITSILGGKLSELAYPLVVLALTHSPGKAGLVPIFWLLPFIVFGLPAGALVDRWNRKRVMILCDSARLLGVALLPAAYLLGHLTVLLVYTAALIEGCGFCFFNLAETAAIPQVVRKRQIADAMAVNEMGYSATSAAGPGLAGKVIGLLQTQVAGCALAFTLDAVSYLASLVTLALIRTPFQQERADVTEASPASIAAEVREGLRFLWGHERIRSVALWAGWLALLFGPFQLALILIVRRDFHLGAGTIGAVLSAGGVGGMIGAALAPQVRQRFPFGMILMSAVGLQAVATGVEAFAPSLIVLAAGQFVIQLAGPIWNVTQMSYRMSVIPDNLQGRVNACFRLLIFALYPLGSAVGGALLEHVGPRPLIAGMAVGGLASVALAATTNLRKA